jgi:hypothetical protein
VDNVIQDLEHGLRLLSGLEVFTHLVLRIVVAMAASPRRVQLVPGRVERMNVSRGYLPVARAKCFSYHATLRSMRSTACFGSARPWPSRGYRTITASTPTSRSAM